MIGQLQMIVGKHKLEIVRMRSNGRKLRLMNRILRSLRHQH
jgi:hypothetical protein